jgi:hypothetical protein
VCLGERLGSGSGPSLSGCGRIVELVVHLGEVGPEDPRTVRVGLAERDGLLVVADRGLQAGAAGRAGWFGKGEQAELCMRLCGEPGQRDGLGARRRVGRGQDPIEVGGGGRAMVDAGQAQADIGPAETEVDLEVQVGADRLVRERGWRR